MSDHPTNFTGNIPDAISTAIRAQLADAVVTAQGSGGHFTIDVVSSEFAGKSLLAQQRLVLGAIKHLINGDMAPVHAVESLTTRTP